MPASDPAAHGGAGNGSLSLFDHFTVFYEEVVKLKTAAAQGALAGYLTLGDDVAPQHGAEFAARVNARLANLLEQQARLFAQAGSHKEIAAGDTARYAMAALADEILILELDWPGCSAWNSALLEERLFQSRVAGLQVFVHIEKLLASYTRSPLDADLALVLLMTLELGFKGKYRGPSRVQELDALKRKLYQFVRGRHVESTPDHVFEQAYQNCQSGNSAGHGAAGARLAPLAPWYLAGGIALGAYLVISTAIWLIALHPFFSMLAQ